MSQADELLAVAVDAASTAGALLAERVLAGAERHVASKSTPTDLVSEALNACAFAEARGAGDDITYLRDRLEAMAPRELRA